jgi:2-methylisocitrate lyase-like PEP mutase family enzyme
MAARLKQLLTAGELILAPGVFEMFSARIADRMGFNALYMTGYGISASYLGQPDAGLVTYTDMTSRARTIAEGTTTPLIADADTGFGGLINVRQTVRGYEAAGVQAIQIEDQEMPKKCGHTPNRRVIPVEDMVQKIEVALEARRSDDTLIIARTDSRTGLGLDEAIRRGQAYAKAGADIIFVEAPETEEEFRRVGAELGKGSGADGAWLLANMVPSGKSPVVAKERLGAFGFNVVIYPSVGMNAACAALKSAYAYLLEHGSTEGSPVPSISMAEMHQLVGFEDVWAFERKHARAP